MDAPEFREMLEQAIAGNAVKIEMLLRKYQPLINKYSFWKGQLDEDPRQYILLHIVQNLSKFVI